MRAPTAVITTSWSCAFFFLRGLWHPRPLARLMMVGREASIPCPVRRSLTAE
ncbi:MAG: hypothetical protein SWK76_11800 [Actinomycetota bacterium]|nr:hypothetical protein [Actinomycetota bacterium]